MTDESPVRPGLVGGLLRCSVFASKVVAARRRRLAISLAVHLLGETVMPRDSPVYGAERRRAPMVAWTRIADESILERGLIASPDIVVVADETPR